MIIAVTSAGRDLDSPIDPRFGRCAFFIIYNMEDRSFEALDNENSALGGGAGIQSAQLIAAKGVKAVITGNCGPNAVQTLQAAGIQLFLGRSGTVREAIESFRNNSINPSQKANVSDHFGMKGENPSTQPSAGNVGTEWIPGSGRRMGRGSGRGMGTCGGKGMGRGMGKGMGQGMGLRKGLNPNPDTAPRDLSVQPNPSNLSRDQELNRLKEQSKELQRQISDIQARIKKMEENG
jgi:predicted Fe-Mo cluster-binding NifX family protein